MIETVNIGAREINLSINPESRTLPEERRSWLYVNKRLSALKKKYYLESEGFIFFDDGKAISIAAQIVKWIHTDIRPGRHYIFLPFDNIVYMATIRVQADYILMEKEELLQFEDCLQMIRSNPLECQVAELGKLSHAFTQHNITLKDLYINLDPGKNNPYLLRRAYSLTELALLALVPCFGAGFVYLLFLSVNVDDIKQTTAKPPPAKPMSARRIHTDLDTVAALLADFSVLLAYDLKKISINKTSKGYQTRAAGHYDQAFSLARLHGIAQQLDGRFILQKTGWSLNSSLFKPPSGEPAELIPLTASLEQYRRFAVANHARFTVISASRKSGAARGLTELSIDYPHPLRLQQTARQLEQMGLHGRLQKAEIKARGSGWNNLTIVIEIIGS